MAGRPSHIRYIAALTAMLFLFTSITAMASNATGRSEQTSTLELEEGPFFLEHRCTGDGCPELTIELRDEDGIIVDSDSGQPSVSIDGFIPISGVYTLSVSYGGEAPLIEVDA